MADIVILLVLVLQTNLKSFQRNEFQVRRRFTDFAFLYKTLSKEYPACGVPPLPNKHNMEYVTGNRFGPDFTSARAHSLNRFLKRLILHPVLRRSALLIIFLESSDWNAHMRSRPGRGGSSGGLSSSSPDGSNGVFDSMADTFVNAFTKVHKPDRRFVEVKEKADKLDEDLGSVEKYVQRTARREGELEADYNDLSQQFLKLSAMEPGVESAVHAFAQAVEATARGMRSLKEHTEQDYLGSLRDMAQYSDAVKALLKSRDQKQMDFEGLTSYLSKSSQERDQLASGPAYHSAHSSLSSSLSSPIGFVRSKVEDLRGIDHEQARKERVRRLELQIDSLTGEVDAARRTSEMFDEEVVKEVDIFERTKASEFRDTLGGLAAAHIDFYDGTIQTWERYIAEMEKEGPLPEL